MKWNDPNRCQHYNRESGGQCRNKVMPDGRGDSHLCRRHVIEQLRKYQEDNPQLMWYLRHQHLLANETTP